MKRCRTCKSFEPDELEMMMVHLWETHGVPLDRLKEIYPAIDWGRVQGLIDEHKETGKKGADMFRIPPK